MSQAQTNKHQSGAYSQLYASKLQSAFEPQLMSKTTAIEYPGTLPLSRYSLSSSFPQSTSNVPKRTCSVDNITLMNLIIENNMLRNQLQALTALQKTAKVEEEGSDTPVKETLSTQVVPKTEEKPSHTSSHSKKKRYRRLAKQIERSNCCPEKSCNKSYGSEGSLHQHIRLKHPDFDILTWIRDKIKYSDALRTREKNETPSTGSCKLEDSSSCSVRS